MKKKKLNLFTPEYGQWFALQTASVLTFENLSLQGRLTFGVPFQESGVVPGHIFFSKLPNLLCVID